MDFFTKFVFHTEGANVTSPQDQGNARFSGVVQSPSLVRIPVSKSRQGALQLCLGANSVPNFTCYEGRRTQNSYFNMGLGRPSSDVVWEPEALFQLAVPFSLDAPGVAAWCPEGFDNMMEKYEKLVERSSDRSAKLGAFLFAASERDSSGMVQSGDSHYSGQRYVDAINGIGDVGGGGIARKESIASATSTKNSDFSGSEPVDWSAPSQGDVTGPLSTVMLPCKGNSINSDDNSVNPDQVPVASAVAGGGYGWHQVPTQEHVVYSDRSVPHQKVMFAENIPRLEDCYMCQKAFPHAHAHADTVALVQRDRIASPLSDPNSVYHSLFRNSVPRAVIGRAADVQLPNTAFMSNIEADSNPVAYTEESTVPLHIPMVKSGPRHTPSSQLEVELDRSMPVSVLQQLMGLQQTGMEIPSPTSYVDPRKEIVNQANYRHLLPHMGFPNPQLLGTAGPIYSQQQFNGNSAGVVSHQFTPSSRAEDVHDSPNSLFTNQNPWNLLHDTQFLPPRPPRVPSGKGSAEEQIRQELQAVAEGVAAFVFQTLPSNPEDVKTKVPEKSNIGCPISDCTGRLQIIKNTDLEELKELGSGTFGTVYHGKWRGSDVAIKRTNDRFFSGKASEQDRMREDFWNEAIKLADLHHPNMLAFYGFVLDGPEGSVANVIEYMPNGSLRTALQTNEKSLDKQKRLLIAMDAAFGMDYLHGKNIVHFDLKGDNLLVNLGDPRRPICKVGDLGLSKVKCQTLISGGARGTLPWMAPELLNCSSSLVSEKVDVFSFGIVLWELLTGEEPYANLQDGAIIGGIVSNTLRPPIPETCDPEWKSLMERCWAWEPSDRPSFIEIANQLRAMAAKIPPKGHSSPQQQSPTSQPPVQS